MSRKRLPPIPGVRRLPRLTDLPGPRRPLRRPSPGPGASPRRARAYRPADLVVLCYLALTGALLIASPLSFEGKARYALLHFGLLLAVALLRYLPRPANRVLRFLRESYPLFGLPFLYDSLQLLNRLVTVRYFDDVISGAEQVVFGAQPSQILHTLLPSPALSDFLHLSYLSYLALFPLVAVPIYIRRRTQALGAYVTTVMLTILFCYGIFIVIPVQGPFHFFGPLAPDRLPGTVAPLVHALLHNASSVGTAFPSSHVAVSVCIWLVARRYVPRLSRGVLVIAAGILVGTVYGGFHYAIDAAAGLVVGTAFGLAGPRIHALLQI